MDIERLQMLRYSIGCCLNSIPVGSSEQNARCLGGWFCLLDLRKERSRWVVVDEPCGDRASDDCVTRDAALEHATRLAGNMHHRTSLESGDPEQNQLAAAIRAGNWIFSFAGLPGRWNQVLMLAVACSQAMIPLRDLFSIQPDIDEYLRQLRSSPGTCHAT